jgi:hypothetical protein
VTAKKSEKSAANPLPPEDLTEARRIARELVKLHRDGAIKTMGAPSFYANLVRDFGATYAGPPSASGPVTPLPESRHGCYYSGEIRLP